MRKVLFILFFLVLNFSARSQYPVTQNIGNANSLVQVPPNGGFKANLINRNFVDTTAANATYIDYYDGAQIYTTSDSSLYWRYNGRWIRMAGSSGGATGSFWSLTGNFVPVTPADFGVGTNDPYNDLPFKTNATTRAIIPLDGFTLSNDTSSAKVFTWNPTSKEWGYANWNNGGGGGGGSGNNIYNIDSTLASNRTVTTSGRYIQFYEDAGNYLKFEQLSGSRFTHLSTSGTFSSIFQNDAVGGIYAVADRSDNPGIGTGGLLYVFNDGTNLELSINNNISGLQNAYDYTRNRPYSMLATESNPIGISLDSSEVRIGKGVDTAYTTIRGIRVGADWQVRLDSINAGGTVNDSMVLIQADGTLVRRNQSAYVQSSDTANSWRVFGNTGTNPITNYLGPNDSVGWRWKINGRNVGFMLPGGYNSGGGIAYSQQLTTYGMLAGNAIIDSVLAGVYNGGLNMLIGPGSGMNIGRVYDTTAGSPSSENIIIGNVGAGPYIQRNSFVTSNGRNTIIGYSGCHSCLTPGENTGVGAFVMENGYRPTKNAVFGASALRSANDASYMTAIGAYASHLTGSSISAVNITSGGSGYTSATVTISAPLNWGSPGSCYTTATATATIDGGVITAITITDPGCGYSTLTGTYPNGGRTEKPVVTITGDGTGATAEAVVTSGSNTTSLGHAAGWLMKAPQYMIYIGSGSEPAARYFDEYGGMIGTGAGVDNGVSALTSLSNAWAIGKNAKVASSHSFVFGAASGGADTLRVGIGIKAPTYALEVVNSRGVLLDSVHISSSGTFSGEQTSLNVGWEGQVNTTGVYNTSVGYKNQTATSSQSHNTSVGAFALRNVVNFGNTAIGSASMVSLNNANGYLNTAVGMYSLYTLTTGNRNAVLGNYTMRYATSASYNTAVGPYAGHGITSGTSNIAIGNQTMGAGGADVGGSPATTGSYNIAMGYGTLRNITSGAYNIGIGHNNGTSLVADSFNVIIGGNSGASIANKDRYVIFSDGEGNLKETWDSIGNQIVAYVETRTDTTNWKPVVDSAGYRKKLTYWPGGGATYTGSNGITLSSNDFQLGGEVTINNTTVTVSTLAPLKFTGSNTVMLLAQNTGTGAAFQATAASTNPAITATNTGGGNGIDGLSTSSGYGLRGATQNSTTNTAISALLLERSVASGTGANGVGVGIDMHSETSANLNKLANQLISKWTDATDATRTSQFDITGVNSAATETFANFQTGGIVRVNNLADTLATKAYARSVGGGGGYTNLTQFVDQTAWRLFYSNGSGDVTELALGSSGQYLKSNGASSAPSWDTPGGSGTVTSVATNDGTGITGGEITTTGTLAIDTANIIATRLQVQHIVDSLAGTISGGDLTVGTTPILSGTANRILFEDGSNVLQQDAGLTYTTAAGLIVNDAGAADIDLRAEGDTKDHLLFVDASKDEVYIGFSGAPTDAGDYIFQTGGNSYLGGTLLKLGPDANVGIGYGVGGALSLGYGNTVSFPISNGVYFPIQIKSSGVFISNTAFVGDQTASAQLHLDAGSATAGTAPLKIDAGTNLTTEEDGAMEYNGTHLYFTIGSTRYQLDQQGGGGITIGTTTITSGTNTRILYNNSGVVGEYTLTGTGTTVVMQNSPTLTTPRIANAGYIADANGNELVIFTTTASAVNEVTFANAATGANPRWTASGGDTDVGIDWIPKAAGKFNFLATTSGATEIRLFEDADNGSNYAGLIAPTTLGSNATITLPTVTSTVTAYKEAAITSNATWSPSGDARDNYYDVTAQAAAVTTISNPSGTAANHNTLTIRVKDDGTARALTWSGTEWRASSALALPTTTTLSRTMYIKFIYNSTDTKWDLVSVLDNFQ